MSLLEITQWSGALKIVKGRNKMERIYYTEDTRLPDLTVTIYDEDGATVDLTGYTFTLSMINKVDGSVKVNASAMAAIVLASGTIKYVWGANDLNTPGVYLAQRVGTVSAKAEYFQETFEIIVEKKVN